MKFHATAMQASRGESVKLLLIKIGTRRVVSVTPRQRFTSGEGPQVPIVQEAVWASKLIWTQRLEGKTFVSAGDGTPFVQSVVRHYTD
jgi:hypothetical protein